MGEVIKLPPQTAAEHAWDHFATIAQRLSDDHSLWADEAFQKEYIDAHTKWSRLFLEPDDAA